MPRLAFVVNNADFLVSHRLVLVKGALAAGYEVLAIAPEGPGRRTLEEAGARFLPWRLERTGQRAHAEALSVAHLASLYARHRPDLVHHVTIKPMLYGSLAARLTGVRGVVNAVSGLGYVFLSSGLKAAVRRQVLGVAYRAALSGANTRVILQNDDDERELRELGLLGDAKVVKIRGSGVNLAQFPERPPPTTEPPLVVLPARMLADKGVEEFVNAARLLRERKVPVRMALVGGEDEGNPAGLARVTLEAWDADGVIEWWGHRADMPHVFEQAAIVCLPSYREGMPRALLEAAAMGRAIVTTDVPGCRDAVAGGAIGRLVPARDARKLADALEALLLNPTERGELGRAAALHARQNFSEDHVLDQHLQLYAELIRG
jgi:glycosyltransferase involved in cell wall biosynthesis